jgi:hypothetical protein
MMLMQARAPRRRFNPYLFRSTLYLSGDGANASTTVRDSSPKNKTVTVFGDAQLDTSVAGLGASSIKLDGTGDYLKVPNNGDFDFGSGDFFVTMYARNTTTSIPAVALIGCWDSVTTRSWALYKDATATQLRIYASSNGSTFDMLSSANTNLTFESMGSLDRLAFGRKAGVFGFWNNGAVSIYSSSTAGTLFAGGPQLWIGADFGPASYLNGWIDELMILKGVCPFTPGANGDFRNLQINSSGG